MDIVEQQKLFDSVERGDTVTMVNRMGQELSGVAQSKSVGIPYGEMWSLDIGKKHSLMVTPLNIIRVEKGN